MRLLIQYHMSQRKAQQILNRTFRHFIRERRIPHQFADIKKALWQEEDLYPRLIYQNRGGHHFLLSLSTKNRFDEHYFEMLANTTSIRPNVSQLMLTLGLSEGSNYVPYYEEPLIPLSSDIWHLQMLNEKHEDMTLLSNQEVQTYLSACGRDSSNISYHALHFHVDLRILKSASSSLDSGGILPGTIIQTADYLAQTGRLRSLHLAGSHLYPEMARQISTRVVRIIDNQHRD